MTLDPNADLVDLLQTITDIESVSDDEGPLADEIEAVLRGYSHLTVTRNGDAVVARTNLGRPERVVIAGHIDTVPIARNLPSWVTGSGDDRLVYGRGTCDQKGGIAVQVALAPRLVEPNRDITWVFYDHEEVDSAKNGLGRLARLHPELLEGVFAVLTEPSNAIVEGGCQGTMRVSVRTRGKASHSARPWLGDNAIHKAGEILDRLSAYEPRRPVVEGLQYHEALNAVRMKAGIAGNIIPDHCEIEVNHRFAPDRDAVEAENYVREFFHGFEVDLLDAMAGARPGLDQPAAAAFVQAVGGTPKPKFGWTDVARFATLGIPAVNFGPGDPAKAHTDDEFCPAKDLFTCHDALLRWLS